jgi:hypothetical protein
VVHTTTGWPLSSAHARVPATSRGFALRRHGPGDCMFPGHTTILVPFRISRKTACSAALSRTTV